MYGLQDGFHRQTAFGLFPKNADFEAKLFYDWDRYFWRIGAQFIVPI
jgi:hypothetical protein